MKEPVSNQRDYLRASAKETSMTQRHWEEEQRGVLGRLFDSIFGRREASEDKIDNEIRRLLQLASRHDQPDHEPAARDQGEGVEPAA
jgi:hypothetical protein